LDTTDVYNNRHHEKPPSFDSFTELTNLHTLAVPRYSFPQTGRVMGSGLPQSLKLLYILGVKEDECEALSTAFSETEVDKVQLVDWSYDTIHEWFGTVPRKTVDYDSFEGLKPSNWR
jgi:hypothetical protein